MQSGHIRNLLKQWENSRPQSDFPDVRINEMIQMLVRAAPMPQQTVVVCGAHGGELAVPLAQAVGEQGQVLPVDHRVGDIRKVIARASRARLFQVEPVLLNRPYYAGERLPLSDTQADTITSLGSLHRSGARAGAVLAELSRVLKPGGKLVVGDLAATSRGREYLTQFVNRVHQRDEEYRFFTRESLAQLARDNGLELVDWRVEHVPWVFSHEAQMLEFVQTLHDIPRVPESELKEALRWHLGFFPLGDHLVLNWDLFYAILIKPAE